MIISDFSKKFNPKIRDLYNDLGILFRYDKKISDQYSIDNDCISIVQNRFQLININRVINYRNNLSDNDFFFFRNTRLPISKLSRLYLIHNVYSNLDLHNMCYVFYSDYNYPN